MPDLENIPYHQQEFLAYCGAACAQMVLKSLMPGPEAAIGQFTLFNSHLNDSDDLAVQWGIAPDEMALILNEFKPNGFTGAFTPVPCASEVEASRKIAFSIFKKMPPPVALVFGMGHWIVVSGYDADRDPVSETDDINISAFYINNPWPPLSYTGNVPTEHVQGDACGTSAGGGVSSYHLPYSTWQSDYMTGIPPWQVSRSDWAGKFMLVLDPDEPGDPSRQDSPGYHPGPAPDESSRREPGLPGEPVAAQDWQSPKLIPPDEAKESALMGLEDFRLRRHEMWATSLEGGIEAWEPYLVQRLDHPDKFYYITPVVAQGREEASIAVSVDAISGGYREAIAMPSEDQSAIPRFNGGDALKMVVNKSFRVRSRYGGDANGEEEIFVRAEGCSLYPYLVWKPCAESFSPFHPFYMIVVGAHHLYVNSTGQVFTELHDNVAGGPITSKEDSMLRKYYSNPNSGGTGGTDGKPEDQFDTGLVSKLLQGELERFGAEAVMLRGLLSIDPAMKDRLRLYLTAQMDAYVAFLRADLLHSEPVTKGPLSPLGGTIVWLREDAIVQVRRTTTAQGAQGIAAFLQGGISNSFMPGAGMGNQMVPTWAGAAASMAGCGTYAGIGGGANGSWAGCGSLSQAGCGTGPTPPTVVPSLSCS